MRGGGISPPLLKYIVKFGELAIIYSIDKGEWSDIMAKIVFFGNYKGGVGKTTSVYNIARYLCQDPYKKKILLLDLDPQSSLSDICIKYYSGVTASVKEVEDEETLNYVYDLNIRKIAKYNNLKLEFDLNKLIKSKDNLYFIPSNLYYPNNASAANKLGLDELAMKMEDTVEYMGILKGILDDIERNYILKDENGNAISEAKFDYIFIDCPPSNNIITKGAFLTADYFAIPTILDGISTNGVIHYIETVAGTYKQYCQNSDDAIIYRHIFGDRPKLLGIFYTFIRGQANYSEDNINFSASLDQAKREAEDKGEEDIAELLGSDYVIKEKYINNYVDIARNVAEGQLPKERSDYKDFTDVFLRRLEP